MAAGSISVLMLTEDPGILNYQGSTRPPHQAAATLHRERTASTSCIMACNLLLEAAVATGRRGNGLRCQSAGRRGGWYGRSQPDVVSSGRPSGRPTRCRHEEEAS